MLCVSISRGSLYPGGDVDLYLLPSVHSYVEPYVVVAAAGSACRRKGNAVDININVSWVATVSHLIAYIKLARISLAVGERCLHGQVEVASGSGSTKARGGCAECRCCGIGKGADRLAGVGARGACCKCHAPGHASQSGRGAAHPFQPFDISDVDSINYGHAIGTANHRRYPVITAVVYGKVSHFASEKHPRRHSRSRIASGRPRRCLGVEIRCEIRNSGSAQIAVDGYHAIAS